MGRLFWKFFLIVWLLQLGGATATGFVFWLEHQRQGHEARDFRPRPSSDPGVGPPPGDHFGPPPEHHGPPHDGFGPGHGPDQPPLGGFGRPIGFMPPLPPMLIGLLVSLLSAAGIAWYIAKPVNRLKKAFAAAGEGQLALRIGDSMGRRKDELTDLGRDFDRMVERLQNLIEAQKRLLHDVSHELRSPLARLHAAIGLARQQPERFEETMTRLEREGERMNTLVGELLTLARLDAGETGVLEAVDLDELLSDLVADAQFEAEQRKIQVALTGTLAHPVCANPALLHRAIENVVRNALRYSPEGDCVTIKTAELGERCHIVIEDHGPGVPDDQLTAIFTPFHRGNERSAGYGLGLAIAQRIVNAAGGSIRAGNRPQGGLQVLIELPISRREGPTA